MNAWQAYKRAGYKVGPNTHGNPYRLKQNKAVQRRLLELCGTYEAQEFADKENLMRELATLAFVPVGDEVVTVKEKRAAIMDIAKLAGHLIDRKEIRQVDEFEEMSTDELRDYIAVTYERLAEAETGGDRIEAPRDETEA